jgi:hypothetical protein
MGSESPILQQIHDRFDTYERYPYTDHSVIINADITSSESGYSIKTYPGGIGYAFDGFVIDVQADGGLFGENGLSRVETSRDFGGLMGTSVEDERITDEGLIAIQGTAVNLPKREGLLLPGDEGFEMFETLHREIQTIKPILAETIALVQTEIKPEIVVFKHKSGGDGPGPKGTKTRKFYGETKIEVQDRSGNQLNVALDSTNLVGYDDPRQALSLKEPEQVVYRAGKATLRYGRSQTQQIRDLDILALTAFSGLHSQIQKLYRPSPARH